LLGNVQVTLQSIQAILAADRQSVFGKALEKVDFTVTSNTAGTRVP